MKHLVLLLALFGSQAAWAIHDPVIPPWPMSISTEPLDFQNLTGEWVAYESNTIWMIDIQANANKKWQLQIQSTALRTHTADGWLVGEGESLVGEVSIQGVPFHVMIFRDNEGTKLRLGNTDHQFYDLKLYKR